MPDPSWADDALLVVTFDRGNATGRLITVSQIQFTLEEQVDSMLRIMMGSLLLKTQARLSCCYFLIEDIASDISPTCTINLYTPRTL